MSAKPKQLEEYLAASLSAIKKGVEADGDFELKGYIEFDLAVINAHEGRGGFKIYVVGAEAKGRSEQVSRIKFKVLSKKKPS